MGFHKFVGDVISQSSDVYGSVHKPPPPGGRIVLTKSEIKIFCHIDTRFPWKTRHIPTPKMFGGSNETIFLHFGGLRNTQNGEN